MRYYIIAGEASGDLHGSNLIRALHELDPDADVRCWGGDRMAAAGAELVKHYRDLAFMGFAEVVKHLGTILGNISYCKKDILHYRPDVLILIDYPGFNMRIASWARRQGFRIVYYISPQVWAWKEQRVKKLKRDVDLMLVILPFEREFYRKWDYEVTYTGHPLIEVISAEKNEELPVSLSAKPVIAVLPGSRKQEIEAKLPIMIEMVDLFPDLQFVVAKAPSQPDELYHNIIGNKNVLLANNAYQLLRQSRAAMVTSGTATLETALFGVPQVVCYRGMRLSYWLAKKLVKIKYISLVNLIMDKPVVKELIQDDLTREQLYAELKKLVYDEAYRSRMLGGYSTLWRLLGGRSASRTAARKITDMLHVSFSGS